MPSLLKDNIHRSLAESLFNEIVNQSSNYYYFLGKYTTWDDDADPPNPENTLSYETDLRSTMISVKKINAKDVSFVVDRRDWASGTVYDQYDPEYSATNPAQSGATNLKYATFYVMNSSFGVYKCLFNNNNSPSTVQPSSLDPTPVTLADGYVWKYLYTIPLSTRNRFLTDQHIPVQRAIYDKFYSNGEISSVVIDNNGTGYNNNLNTLINVTGTFKGNGGNVIANLTPVVYAGEIIDVLIENAGNNYSNISLSVTDSFSSGRSKYRNIANVKIFNSGSGYNTDIRANTTVSVTTTGAFQPNANAILSPIYSNNNLSNSVVDILVIDPGEGYSLSAIANTTLTISTSGVLQPTQNASANVFFSNTAILVPVLKDGRVDRVNIIDPGANYPDSSNASITIAGDGTGAVLVPVINAAGQLDNVIVTNRGYGYSYATISVAGGSNANIYATLSVGDLNSLQSIVELSAINGGVYALRVDDGGNNYIDPVITIVGNGSGFSANAVLVSNSISYITVTSPGSGYTYGNVTLTDATGANANLSVIFSPYGGHGSDAVSELFADTIMLYTSVTNETVHGKSVTNDYRQFGIIKNLKNFNNNGTFIEASGASVYLATLNTVAGLSKDDYLYLNLAVDRYFDIIDIYPSGNLVLLNPRDNYNLTQGDSLINSANTTYTVSVINQTPDINKLSGDLLYINNKTPVTYSTQQEITLRTVLKL